MAEFGAFELPDEIKEAFMAKIEQGQMEHAEKSLRMERFLFEMKRDDLHTFSQLLDVIIGDKRMATYYQGIVDALLQERHHVCAIHNVDHTAEAMDALESSTIVEASHEPHVDSETVALWKRYRIRPSPGPHGDRTFVCVDCNYPYGSLDDRMIKGPDDCPGCETKAKFG